MKSHVVPVVMHGKRKVKEKCFPQSTACTSRTSSLYALFTNLSLWKSYRQEIGLKTWPFLWIIFDEPEEILKHYWTFLTNWFLLYLGKQDAVIEKFEQRRTHTMHMHVARMTVYERARHPASKKRNTCPMVLMRGRRQHFRTFWRQLCKAGHFSCADIVHNGSECSDIEIKSSWRITFSCSWRVVQHKFI